MDRENLLVIEAHSDDSAISVSGLLDKHRALKLELMRLAGQAYQFDPLLGLKRRLFRRRYALKGQAYNKSIRPKDVRAARLKLAAGLARRPS